MDTLAKNFLETGLEKDATGLIKYCRQNSLWNIGINLYSLFKDIYPFSRDLLDEYSICLYYTKKYEEAHKNNQKILKFTNLSETDIKHILFNDHFNYSHIQHKYSDYDQNLVKEIESMPEQQIPLVTFSITTCKRLNLFTKTMNSFIACCLDRWLISEWICVDDNSTEEDRNKMQELYPFFTFVFKEKENKGHARSMNIIRERVKTPYLLHIEDDWEFFIPRNYLTDALNVLNNSDKIYQCLFNQNYGETAKDIDIQGGFLNRTIDGLPYFIHDNSHDFINKYGNVKNCAYWPHFSFRPSVIKTSIFKELGEYNETADHFEIDYAKRYANSGKVSAFFPGIHCIHIGRLTSERFDESKQNAYTLNNESQFTNNEKNILQTQMPEWLTQELKETLINATMGDQIAIKKLAENEFNINQKNDSVEDVKLEYKPSSEEIKKYMSKTSGLIINMDNREDRLKNVFEQTNVFQNLKLTRFSAINGFKLKPNLHLSRLFDGNDYNMRRGMVGCAMSHIKIMIDFLLMDKEYCLVLEDDIKLTGNFEEKLTCILSKLPSDFGLVYLGYHIRDQFINSLTFSKTSYPIIHPWTAIESLKQSMGGTFGYVISKRGCRDILNFIDKNGMTNGIDTIQQKAASVTKIFYCEPMLVISECYRGREKVDSDIQYDYSSLTIPFETRLEMENDELSQVGKVYLSYDWKIVNEFADKSDLDAIVIYDSRIQGRLSEFIEKIKYKISYYILDNLVVVFFPEKFCYGIYKIRGKTKLTWEIQDGFCGCCDDSYSIDKCLEYEN
jgi:GR25 family glycosyltransferase involved in LPS biosynthesis